MLGATGFFTFHHRLDPKDDSSLLLTVIYKPPGDILEGALDELLLSISKRPIHPDAVVFLQPELDREARLESALMRESVQVEWLRLRGRASLLLASMNSATGVVKVKVLERSKPSTVKAVRDALEANLADIIVSGVASVFKPEEVVLLAPPGYAYQKPSGKQEKFFLKPDVALSSSASVAFVGFALFKKLDPKRLSQAKDLRYVYIDTMAIAPVAYALRDLIGLAQNGPAQTMIESFHSYGGMDKVTRPLPRTAICIISASTSMSMHERWIVQKSASADEVVTLLTAAPVPEAFASGALHVIARPSRASSDGPPQLCIRLDGESFMPSLEPAKKVLLSELIHGTKETEVFRALSPTDVFDVWRRPAASGAATRPLYVDGMALVASVDFLEWLDVELLHRVRAATKMILHQDDPGSAELARIIKLKCESQLRMDGLSVVSASQLDKVELDSDAGVLVCAAVIGKGSQLLEISRGLRDMHTGPRLYVVGIQVTETRDEVKSLPPNLQHAKPVKHDFTAYRAVSIGQQLARSFQAEVQQYFPASADLGVLPSRLRDRARALGGVDRVGQLALLPCGPSSTDAMELRPGFAYWPGTYKAGPHHACVLGTVGVLLQRAREDQSIDPDRRLSSSSFRHVLLDPENFARFNDGVIQAALLRNAFPSELDYRMNTAASAYMKAILMRMLSRSGEPAGEGILEFLLAIVLKRLQLDEQHEADVISAAKRPGRNPEIQAAIDYVLKPLDGAQAAQQLPF